ncbi:MAG: Smr/MutS family protein [Alphaproteobacteria bacterium]|nr:Smr/MutS family protein [Alphaproteobacteria bacterium]OJV14044.1 MAG: hypothetical protein BGO27_00955 [Alphaproteobacteria bacterium 33-17]
MTDENWKDFTKSVKKINKKPKVSKTYATSNKVRTSKIQEITLDEFGILFDKTISYTKKQAKKLRKRDVERTIDLHGQTTEQAFLTLKSFLIDASTSGVKCVIAICGKGMNEKFEFKGKIKQNIEHWLEGFKKSGIITNYITAERSLGGEGAYRIYIKSKLI